MHEEGRHPRKVQLWDVPGDAPDDIPTMAFAATDVFVITADATSKHGLDSVPRLVEAVSVVREVRGRPIPVVLLVTKMDVVSASPPAIMKVRQGALRMAEVLGITVKFCSAFDGIGLDGTWDELVRLVPVSALMLTPPSSPTASPRVAVSGRSPRSAGRKGLDSFLQYLREEEAALRGLVGDTRPSQARDRSPLEADTLPPHIADAMQAVQVDAPVLASAQTPVQPPLEEGDSKHQDDGDGGVEAAESASEDLLAGAFAGAAAAGASQGDTSDEEGSGRGSGVQGPPSAASTPSPVPRQEDSAEGDEEDAVAVLDEASLAASASASALGVPVDSAAHGHSRDEAALVLNPSGTMVGDASVTSLPGLAPHADDAHS